MPDFIRIMASPLIKSQYMLVSVSKTSETETSIKYLLFASSEKYTESSLKYSEPEKTGINC